MSDTVSEAMAEIVDDMQQGLLALAVGSGLQVMRAIMQEDVSAVCGSTGRHNSARSALWHDTEAGSVTFGGVGCRCRGRGCAASTTTGRGAAGAFL